MREEIKTAAEDFLERHEELFSKAARIYPFPGASDKRTVNAFNMDFHVLYMPWRGVRREKGKMPSPFSRDRAYEIISREAIWRKGKYVVTPNKYPFAERQLLLWEDDREREPGEGLITLSLAILGKLEGMTGLMNTTGSAATIAKAHMQMAGLGRKPAVSKIPLEWMETGGILAGFPERGSGWPGFFVAMKGDPERVGNLTKTLLIQRRCPAFNIIISENTLYLFPRLRETEMEAYPYPLGALELAGCFAFEHEETFLSATGERIEKAISASCYPLEERFVERTMEVLAGGSI